MPFSTVPPPAYRSELASAVRELDAQRTKMPADPQDRTEKQELEFAQVEARVSILGIKEVLYGGPSGEGLVYVVKRLAETSELQQKTLQMLNAQLTSDTGLNKRLTQLEQSIIEEKINFEKKHEENKKNFRLLLGLVLGVVTPMLTALLWRMVYIISNPVAMPLH